MPKNKKTILFKNTLIVILTGFLVKFIGMVGKIITTRILKVDGMSLYVLSYPTLLMFINISGFSLNTSISKLVAEGVASKKYSPDKILKKGIKLSLLISLICMLLYVCSIKYISYNLLKNENLFYPLLSGIILIPLTGASDALRGYFNGLKKMNYASKSLLLEQITRTVCSLISLLFIEKGLIFVTCMLFISLSIGEIASITYCLIKIKKEKLIKFENTRNETKVVFNMSFSLTLSRLFGSLTYFLEPILYTFILTKLNYSTIYIHTTYTTIDAYTIPLLTLISFFPFAIATAILPHISESFAKLDYKKLNYYIHKELSYVFYPAILSLIIIFFYSNELMLLIFKSTSGAKLASIASIFFIFFYFNHIFVSILQAIGKVKTVFINSVIFNTVRLILIVVLALNVNIGGNSILFASIITTCISTLDLFFFVKKYTMFKISVQSLINMLLISLFAFAVIYLLHSMNLHYLCVIIITSILYFFVVNKFVLKYRINKKISL